MPQINSDSIIDFLSRFGQFYDTVLRKFEIIFTFHGVKSCAVVLIAARDQQSSENEGWVFVRLVIEDVTEMRCAEGNISYTVLSEALHISCIGDITYIDFGALQDKDPPNDMNYSLDEFRHSPFYIGGRNVTWDILPYSNEIS